VPAVRADRNCGKLAEPSSGTSSATRGALGHGAIVYGPLDRLPVEPEAALVLATAEQAMVLAEALDVMRADAGGLRVLGRPMCSAIPAALASGEPRGSLACTGARLYAGMEPGEMLLVIPVQRFDGLAERIAHALRANAAVAAVGQANLAAVEG
jgi:uncharacterized protein (DUF169 family)